MTEPAARSAAPSEPPLELVERFKASLDRLWPEGGKLGLAVSGGPDSLALLLLAEAAIPGQFEVATVDHGLRPEAVDECAFVAQVCVERGVPCEILDADIVSGDFANLQAAARFGRYGALTAWAEERQITTVATAHHANDQAETLLMRLNRASGVAGLAGVRESIRRPASDVFVIRPLLSFRRSELTKIVANAGLTAVDDPSNHADKFDRVRVRKALVAADWIDPLALTLSAKHLADADEALRWATNLEVASQCSRDGDAFRYVPRAPKAILVRVVERLLTNFGSKPRGGDVARLVQHLEEAKGGTLNGARVTVEGEEWVFRPEPPRRTG